MTDQPLVSILIAARNEEDNILSCLQSLERLSFPNYEVWIGNDASEDQTELLVQHFIEGKPSFQLLTIQHALGKAKGKANVLAHLARKARGTYLLITDADVQVPENWIQGMLPPNRNKTKIGCVTGCTIPVGENWWAKMQTLDWGLTLAVLKQLADWGLPMTAMGNNMLVLKKAYEETGGYEQIPFSITEDYELFRQLRNKGWAAEQVYDTQVLAKTQPVSSLRGLLQQRKRWMYGAFQVPLWVKIGLVGYALFLPLSCLLIYLAPSIGIAVLCFKLFVQFVWSSKQLRKIGLRHLRIYLPLHEIYSNVFLLLAGLYYLLPFPVIWKGRKY